MQICVLTLPSSSTILHPDLFHPIFPSIGYITSTLHFYLMHWMTGNLAESCTQRALRWGEGPGWWNLSSYHTNHYLSNPLLQSKGASIFWRGNQGRGRKAAQINSDKGLFSAALIYDGDVAAPGPGQGLYQTSWYIFDSHRVFTIDEVLPKIFKSNDFDLKKIHTFKDSEIPERHTAAWD